MKLRCIITRHMVHSVPSRNRNDDLVETGCPPFLCETSRRYEIDGCPAKSPSGWDGGDFGWRQGLAVVWDERGAIWEELESLPDVYEDI